VQFSHVSGDGFRDALWELNFLQELKGNIVESISWPLKEPIDLSTVDKSWEHSSSESELVSDWGEAKSNMQVSSDSVEEELEEFIGSILKTLTLSSLSHLSKNCVELVLGEELRNPS
jgi:hypothetical protein